MIDNCSTVTMSTAKESLQLRIQDEDIEVFPKILSFYSPVIQDLCQKNNIRQLEEETSKLMKEYLQFFQLEKRHEIEIDVEAVNELMALSEKYQTSWMNIVLEDYIIKTGVYEDSEFEEEANCKRNLQGLLMAHKYDMTKLENKLVNFNYCAFDKLKMIDGFDELDSTICLKLAIKRIPHAVHEDKSRGVFETLSGFFENKKQKKEADDIYMMSENEADVVITCKHNKKIHAHLIILEFFSKFEISTSGNKTTINMQNISATDVETFFRFLYANQPRTFPDSTNFDVLLSLSCKYGIDWMTSYIEDHIIKNYQTALLKDLFWEKDVMCETLVLADKYHLDRLRKHLLKKQSEPEKFMHHGKFNQLSTKTKYLVVRKCISMHPAEENGVLSNEGKCLVQFMDKHFK